MRGGKRKNKNKEQKRMWKVGGRKVVAGAEGALSRAKD